MGNSFNTACCSGRKNKTEIERVSAEDKTLFLRDLQAGVVAILVIYYIIFGLIIAASLVPGFPIQTPGGNLAVPHVIWMLGPWFVSLVGFLSVYFSVVFDVRQIVNSLWAFQIVLIIHLFVTIVHLVFSFIEVAQNVTDLALQNQWALITLIVLLFLMAFLEAWAAFFRVPVFRTNLQVALMANWRPGEQKLSASSSVEAPLLGYAYSSLQPQPMMEQQQPIGMNLVQQRHGVKMQ